MKDLIIKGDIKTPTVELRADGNLLIEGRAIPESPEKLFDPILKWFEEAEFENVDLTMRMEYFNTTASKHFAMMFKKIEENEKIQNIVVSWFYEEGDDDSYESGIMYKDEFKNIEFEFFVFQ